LLAIEFGACPKSVVEACQAIRPTIMIWVRLAALALALAARCASGTVVDYDFRARGDPAAIADLFGA
jgi:hypothetical protein